MSSQSANNGPHNSKLANKLDPRVDSSKNKGKPSQLREHPSSANKTYNPRPILNSADYWGSSKLGDARNYGKGGPSGTGGPHHTKIANTLDPRVDSDRDNGARHEAIADSSYAKPKAGHTAGPHKSDVANKMDPRVDSDLGNWTAGGTQDGV